MRAAAKGIVLAATLAAAVGSAPPAAAQSMVVELLPELRELPAPDWVKPGVELTFYGASGGSREAFLRPDPEGGLVDVNDPSKRFSVEPAGGAAGHGYVVVTIIGVTPQEVTYEVRSYVLPDERLDQTPVCAAIAGGSDLAACAGEYWVHPQALRKALERPQVAGYVAGRLELRGGQGQTIPAIFFGTHSAAGHVSYTYDARTGLLLHSSTSHRSQRPAGWIAGTGTVFGGEGWVATAVSFRMQRQVGMPWGVLELPERYRPGASLWFAGSATHSSGAQLPVRISAQIRARSAGGVVAYVEQVTGIPPLADVQGVPRALGTAGRQSPWYPPAGLRRLEQGQLLIPRHPYTHVSTWVAYRGEHQGRDVVVLRDDSPLQTLDAVYDTRTGEMIESSSTDRTLGLFTQVQLQR